jgi:hypothetical protein
MLFDLSMAFFIHNNSQLHLFLCQTRLTPTAAVTTTSEAMTTAGALIHKDEVILKVKDLFESLAPFPLFRD